MKKNSKKWCLLVGVFLSFSLIYTFLTRLTRHTVTIATDPMTILLWTKWCGKTSYPYFPEDIVDETCPYSCIYTRDRRNIYTSGAVLFHGKDMSLEDMPVYRHPDQRWIFFSLEPPTHMASAILDRLRGIFNVTLTYRLDSDVPSQYGYTFEPRRAKPRKPKATNKTGFAAWFVSNCKTQSRRESYVAELRKTVPVDVYGRCGNLTCEPKASDTCYQKIANKYYFYLAFENSICTDYATEKFYRPLKYDIVPVVLGGANYTSVAPRMSYINALDFDSPAELGRYLSYVAGDRDAFQSYLTWKSKYRLKYENLACKLCTKMHSLHASGKLFTYYDFKKWLYEDARCRSWERSQP
ncbi:alpha-(1,3)-fucosyltransferase C-like [Ornithodoros turicata]|uniref:alpha-(1,3)-fucosyltransferase C-like n=1 Tax=Ornithodoros turicata TaxID=34597 RepID=UPI003139E613